MVERRKHPRTPKGVRVRWRRVTDGADGPLVTGPAEPATTRDVSQGGLAFCVSAALPVGEPLALELDREFGGPPLSALGRVARCEPADDGWIVGVELTWIESTQWELSLGTQPGSAWTLL